MHRASLVSIPLMVAAAVCAGSGKSYNPGHPSGVKGSYKKRGKKIRKKHNRRRC